MGSVIKDAGDKLDARVGSRVTKAAKGSGGTIVSDGCRSTSKGAFVIDRNSAPLAVSEEILGDQATTSDSDDNVPLGRVHRNRRFVDEDSDDAHWEE